MRGVLGDARNKDGCSLNLALVVVFGLGCFFMAINDDSLAFHSDFAELSEC